MHFKTFNIYDLKFIRKFLHLFNSLHISQCESERTNLRPICWIFIASFWHRRSVSLVRFIDYDVRCGKSDAAPNTLRKVIFKPKWICKLRRTYWFLAFIFHYPRNMCSSSTASLCLSQNFTHASRFRQI